MSRQPPHRNRALNSQINPDTTIWSRREVAVAGQQYTFTLFGIIGEQNHLVVPSVANGQSPTTLLRNGAGQGGFAALASSCMTCVPIHFRAGKSLALFKSPHSSRHENSIPWRCIVNGGLVRSRYAVHHISPSPVPRAIAYGPSTEGVLFDRYLIRREVL